MWLLTFVIAKKLKLNWLVNNCLGQIKIQLPIISVEQFQLNYVFFSTTISIILYYFWSVYVTWCSLFSCSSTQREKTSWIKLFWNFRKLVPTICEREDNMESPRRGQFCKERKETKKVRWTQRWTNSSHCCRSFAKI